MAIHRNKDGFLIFPDLNKKTFSLVIESSKLGKYIAYLKKNRLTKIDLTSNFGFKQNNIDFIADLDLTHIQLWDIDITDNTPLYTQKKLKDLRYTNVKTKTILDFSRFKKLNTLLISWDDRIRNIELNKSLKTLYINHYYPKEKNLSAFPLIPNLETLDITGNIVNLKGLPNFRKLKKLRLDYCLKLESIKDVTILKNSLTYLYIGQSKKLKDHAVTTDLKNLETLCFNSCGEIKSLDFLRKLKKLKDFRFVDTNIKDGNLAPLVKHPHLKHIAFNYARHFSHTEEEITLATTRRRHG